MFPNLRTARSSLPGTICSWAITALIAMICAFPGCSHEAKEKEPVVAVQSAVARMSSMKQIVEAEAILFPIQQSALVPKISAPVKKFFVNRGSHVHAGELLAVLENKDLSAGAVQSKGEYQQAEAAYATATAANLPEEIQKAELDTKAAKDNLDAQQRIYDSRTQLYAQGALPRKELDAANVALTEARNQFEIAQRHLDALNKIGKEQELKSASGQLTAAKGKFQGAEAQLSYSEIRSPINGVITDRPLYAGEMTAAGTPMLTVMDNSQLIAKAHIPQSDAALLHVGAPASVSDGSEKPLEGKVTVISPALDPNSTTVEIWVTARNVGERMKPGTSVKLSIVAQSVPDALTIPVAALLTTPNEGPSVMLVGDDGRAHQRQVKVGIKENNDVQIVSGVKPGERVITTGAFGLPDKTRVKLEPDQRSQDGTAAPEKD
jgi:HlyD family secretion protein